MTDVRSHLAVIVFTHIASAAFAQTPPAVTKLDPPHLATGVDAKLVTQLVVTFDQDMDTTAHAVCGGGPSFPKVISTDWRSPRTFVIDVQLGDDRVYAMDLSCAASGGFRSKAGVRMPLVPWRIATAGGKLAPGLALEATNRLFAAVTERYSYRDRLGIDWRDLEKSHREARASSPNGATLALGIAQLMQSAQDPHVSVQWNDATLPTWQRDIELNYDPRGLQKALPKLAKIGRIGLQGRTDDNIGYVQVGSFAREQRDDFELALDAVRAMLGCKAIVIDVRTNGGGDELIARRLAAYFVPGEKVYAAHRIRDPKAPEGFQPRQERRMRGNEPPELFTGPVAVLMGPANMSSCEAFLLMMKQAPKALLVGAESYGSSGNPQPHVLGPGLTVMLPSWQALQPDGSTIEGEGITPHIHVKAPPTKFVDGDPVLEEALLRLRG